MKNILMILFTMFALNASAQEINKQIEDPNKHKQVMLNLCTREGITTFPEFKDSYDANYKAYVVDSTIIAEVKKHLKGKKIKIVLGTWCGDSKLQVPYFLKLMDAAGIDAKKIQFIAVDGQKHADNGLIDNLNITRVPTFIFYDKKDHEIARITEFPADTFEKDIIKLLATTK